MVASKHEVWRQTFKRTAGTLVELPADDGVGAHTQPVWDAEGNSLGRSAGSAIQSARRFPTTRPTVVYFYYARRVSHQCLQLQVIGIELFAISAR